MIVIIGAGALGSHVTLMLRNLEESIKGVDFDKVEMKNTQAQFHTKMSLRRNKAASLGQALRGMFGVEIESVPYKLTDANTSTIFLDTKLIVDCTDNIKARKLIQGYAKKFKTPCVHGALSGDGTFGRIVWTEDFTPDAEGADGEATCEDGEALPFFVLVSSVLAVEVQRFLETGKKSNFQVTLGAVQRM